MYSRKVGLIFCLLLTRTIVRCVSPESIPSISLTVVLEPVPLDWQLILENGTTTTTKKTYFHIVSPTPIEENCQNSTYCWNKLSLDLKSTNMIQFVFQTPSSSSSSSGKEMILISNPDIPVISHVKMKSYSCPDGEYTGQIIFSANIAVEVTGSNYQPLLSSMDSIQTFTEFDKQCGLESQLQFQPSQNASISELSWHSSYSSYYLAPGILPYTLKLKDLYIQGLDWHRQINSQMNGIAPTHSPFPDPGKPTGASTALTIQSCNNFLTVLSCFVVVVYFIH